MSAFFETIYGWFESLYGAALAEHLVGILYDNDTCEQLDGYGPNQFISIGFIAVGISLALVLLYYYAINHPRFNRWWSWLLVLLASGLINFFIGANWTLSELNSGNISKCLLENEQGQQLLSSSDCWMFGLANGFVAAIEFIVFSIGLKWWSRNCSRSPF